MLTFATLGDMLLRRYVRDYIAQAQQLSMPIYSMLREDSNFTPSGDGAFFPIRIQGNESGGGWRGTDDNSLPASSNELIKQHRVRPKKFFHVVEFSGLAEAVSARGGEDAFAAGVNDAISAAIKRAGAIFETTFVRGDGTGRLTNVSGTQAAATTLNVDDARPFRRGQVVEFLNNSTGLKQDGPVTVTDRSISGATITLSAAVSVTDDDGIYIAGEQSGSAPVSEVTALGLPSIVNNTGTIYNLSRTTYPVLQAKVINASSTALDESMLRRLRKQVQVETDAQSTADWAYVTNWDQFDRYTEITLPFRRFNDMTLDLGANQSMTRFEGRPWLLSWVALPDTIFMLKMDSVVRGVVRPFSIDERINAQWIPGTDSFSVVMKYYGENVARVVNQCARINNLTTPTY